jgi:hypothetical protein
MFKTGGFGKAFGRVRKGFTRRRKGVEETLQQVPG